MSITTWPLLDFELPRCFENFSLFHRLFAVKQLFGKRYYREVLVELVGGGFTDIRRFECKRIEVLEFDRPCWDMGLRMVLRELKEI